MNEKNNIPKSKLGVLIRDKNGRKELYDPETEQSIELNDSAFSIFQLCDGKNTEKDILCKLAEEYGLEPGLFADDVSHFLTAAKGIGIIEGPPKIDRVVFGVTGRCNLRCKHCCARETWQSPEFTTEKIMQIIDEFIDIGVNSVNISGGEPFMRDDIIEIVEKLRKNNISVLINTNGILVSPQIVKELRSMGVTKYCISLDGASASVHDRQRGAGSFDKTVKAIRRLASMDILIYLSFIVTRINEAEIEELCELGRELGIYKVRYNHMFYTGNALCYENEIYINPQDNIRICRRIGKLRDQYGDFILGTYLDELDKLNALGSVPPRESLKIAPCPAGFWRLAVRPDGWVTPCEILWEEKAGNLHEKSLRDILDNSEVIRDMRSVKTLDLADMPECLYCDYQFICFSGHRCYPYHYPGGIMDKKYYCYKNKS